MFKKCEYTLCGMWRVHNHTTEENMNCYYLYQKQSVKSNKIKNHIIKLILKNSVFLTVDRLHGHYEKLNMKPS